MLLVVTITPVPLRFFRIALPVIAPIRELARFLFLLAPSKRQHTTAVTATRSRLNVLPLREIASASEYEVLLNCHSSIRFPRTVLLEFQPAAEVDIIPEELRSKSRVSSMQDLGVGARFGVEVWPGLVGLQLRVSGDEMDGIQASGSGPDADDALKPPKTLTKSKPWQLAAWTS